jgi:hypothetical protein
MSFCVSREKLDVFCLNCEKELQKAVFNNKFLRYGKSLCGSLFLCVLCLVKDSLYQDIASIKIGKWDTKASKYPNIFVTLSSLEMRKHCDSKHAQPSSTLDFINLNEIINSVSWKEASQIWRDKHSVQKQLEKTQKKQFRDLAKWSVKEFGFDHTRPMIGTNNDGKQVVRHSNHINNDVTPQGEDLLIRSLTEIEKSMDHVSFLKYAYKDIPLFKYRDVTPAQSSLISKMSFDEFTSYSSSRRRSLRSKNDQSFKTFSPINFDDLEDFSDQVTYKVKLGDVSDALFVASLCSDQLLEPWFEQEVHECAQVIDSKLNAYSTAISSSNPVVEVHCDTDKRRVNHNNDVEISGISLPDLCDCPLDPHFIDLRDEWGVEPQQIIYSPPIISSLLKSGDFGNLSGYVVVQNDHTVQLLNVLRNSNLNFKEFKISAKYRNYQEMSKSIQKVVDSKSLDISLCKSKTERNTLLKGIFKIRLSIHMTTQLMFREMRMDKAVEHCFYPF